MNATIETVRHTEPPLLDETCLVRQAKTGDPEAFAQLYDAYMDRVYRYIFFRVTDEMTAEDLTSQVFLKAWESLGRYKIGKSPFLAWLYTIARNHVIDHYRTRKESVSLDDVHYLASENRQPDDEVQMGFEADSIHHALQFLTEDQQQVLILRFIGELPTEEIAEIMDKRTGAVRALQMRGLQTMAKHLVEKELV